jgi:superoxide dismutase, Cu-Zn family
MEVGGWLHYLIPEGGSRDQDPENGWGFQAGEYLDRLGPLQGEKTMKTMRPLLVAAATVLLAACQTTPESKDAPRATAQLNPTKGNKTFGEATFEQVGNKVRTVIFVQGLKPGQEHGLHIHEGADCSGDAMGAKGHFNPHGKPHGRPDSAERHAGDLPPLRANKAGRANVQADIDIITVTPGPASIIGRALVVHADPDDFKTQPTGNSGARIACGVIQPQ